MYFIDVILPIPLRQTFTYHVNKDEAIFLQPGMRVSVPFGKSKIFTAIVYQVHQTPPQAYETKSIDQILDEQPIIVEKQLRHWEWMAQYYMCTLGEVVRAALPSAFLLESETIIHLEKEFEVDESKLSDDEFLLLEALQNQQTLHINDVRNILDRKRVVGVIQNLMEKGVLSVQEEVYEQYQPKLKRYLKLAPAYSSEDALRDLLDSLQRAPKQRSVLMSLFTLSAKEKNVESLQLQKHSQSSAAILKSLIDKGILQEYFLQQDRLEYKGEAPSNIKDLSEAQALAYEQIDTAFQTKDIVLLHGVTSS